MRKADPTAESANLVRPIQFLAGGEHAFLPAPLIRLTTCGLLTIEVVSEVVSTDPPLARYIALPSEQLRGRGTAPALMLLKLLVSQPQRFALRDWLMEQFRHDRELFSSVRLDNIVSLLRGLLCPATYEDLRTHLVAHVRSSAGSGDGYQLAPYPLVWLDSDALACDVEQAARMERYQDDPLPYWERAYALAKRGVYLSDGIYSDWATARRTEVTGMLRQSVQALARLYLARQGEAGEEEALLLLRSYWQEHPREEDALRPLMELLGRRERYQEALEYYRRLERTLEEEGGEPDARTRDLSEYLRTKQRHPSERGPCIATTAAETDTPPAMDVLAEQRATLLPPEVLPAPSEQSVSGDLLRALLDCEMSMFDPEKRKTLETFFMALSLATLKPQGALQPFQPAFLQGFLSPDTGTAKINEATIQGYASLIDACWQLSRGNELVLAEKLLSEYMSKLVPLAQQPSPYQQSAARLAAQGYSLCGTFTLHLKNNLPASILYHKQAVQYSALSGDRALQVASMRILGTQYHYQRQHSQALQTYLDTLPYAESASPLFQAGVHMGLAVAYAYVGQQQEAFTHLGLANDLFPNDPETDRSFSYAEFDRPRMILWEGVTRSQLGQADQALDIFNQIEQQNIIMPERTRIEIMNQQAKTAIGSGDLEQGFAYVLGGVAGAKALGSQRRMQEAYENYQQMALLWPQDKRVKHLGALFPLR